MKKLGVFFLVLLLVMGCSSKRKFYPFNTPYKKYSFFKEENTNRYLSYQKNHPSFSIEEVITYVNLGLDKPFYTYTKESPYLNKKEILINKYIYVPRDYKPNHLVQYAKPNLYLVEEAKNAYIEMAKQAEKDNLHIRVISAYRDVSYQENLYASYQEKDSVDIVDTYSARPMFSEHHSGLCVDLDNVYTSYEYFEYTDEYTWMLENAYKYGFILRYPKGKESISGYQFESWHYRYVGKKISTYLHRHPITFDEYYVQFIEKN